MAKARRAARLFILLVSAAIVCLLPAAASGGSSSLTTLFSGNITFQGNMFNVTVQPDADIVITAFDINILASGQPVPMRVYWRDGGYQGYETNAGAWTLLQESDVTSSGVNHPTHLPLTGGLAIPAGKTYGIYITVNGGPGISEMVYTHSASVYYDTHISISTAAGLSWPLFTEPFSPRTWNGTIYYNYAPLYPQTGDAAGAWLWLYLLITVLSGGTVVLLINRYYAAHRRA